MSRSLANHLPAAPTRQGGVRLILLTTPLDPDLVGFMAARTTAPVRRTVPIALVGTASRDHLTVPQDAVATAFGVLRQVREAAMRESAPSVRRSMGTDA